MSNHDKKAALPTVHNADEPAECSVCLEPIGWHYPLLPHIGSVCIRCSQKLDAKAPTATADVVDPATTLVLPKCPWCNRVLNAFITSFHYSKCSEAPEEVRKLGTSVFDEHSRNKQSRDKWVEYMTMIACSSPGWESGKVQFPY